MKKLAILAILFSLLSSFTGCSTGNSQQLAGGETKPTGYPVDAQSSIELATYFKYWPELSGYYLPAGIYKAEKEDTNGVFFKAPAGLKLLSLTGSTLVEGGIYLPKLEAVHIRGYVYLHMPLMGWESYMLPDDFFMQNGGKWKVLQSNAPPPTAQPPAPATP
jgi:hypothetical protein